MSHAHASLSSIPARLIYDPAEAEANGAGDDLHRVRLLVRGQGTIGFALATREPFTVTVRDRSWGAASFRWTVDFDGARLAEHREGKWCDMEVFRGAGWGLDPEERCRYWFSFDEHNRTLRYGKGETRLGCQIAWHLLDPRTGKADDRHRWFAEAHEVEVAAAIRGTAEVWRDPIVVEPPMKVVSHDRITMDDMAAGLVTVPANLSPTCQILYDNVAGEAFRLDEPDFPFAEAIRRSIDTPGCWCHETLRAKAAEFGKPDLQRTYLRITLGQNQGESPGIPFVMEIWPSGHYSPIHNHGGSEAVIKVLHGEITVDLYPMLSPHHQAPFGQAVFGKDEVAWVSGGLNQVHRLVNRAHPEPCITIQCYLYAATNEVHWPYFDYLTDNEIGHFDPNSDMDYVAFKALIRQEWAARDPVT